MNSDLTDEKLTLTVFARTDVGQLREGNEDAFLVADLTTGKTGIGPEMGTHQVGERGSLLVVADGMGGAAAGEVASEMTVTSLLSILMESSEQLPVTERLPLAVQQTNKLVWEHSQAHPGMSGMGATLTAVLIHDGTAYIAQVGDSRAYLVREEQIKQLTKDQSYAQILADTGAFSADIIASLARNVLVQAIGVQAEIQVALVAVELCRNDVLLVCSDGLYNKVEPEEMRETALAAENPVMACRSLVELANERGGEDNITVVLARFDGQALSATGEGRRITGSWRLVTDYQATGSIKDEIEKLASANRITEEVARPEAAPPPKPVRQTVFMKSIPVEQKPVVAAPTAVNWGVPPVAESAGKGAERPGASSQKRVVWLLILGIVVVALLTVGYMYWPRVLKIVKALSDRF